MSTTVLTAESLTTNNFSDFGNVIETAGKNSFKINNEMCTRFDNLAEISFDIGVGKPIISIFRGKPYQLPIELNLMERHPLGSQAFIPIHKDPFLVIVASDLNGRPDIPKIFITNGNQGVNIFKNTWHGVLTPVVEECDFLVVDRSGPTSNLEEFLFEKPIILNFNLNPGLIAPQ